MKSQMKALVVGSMTALVGISSPAAVFANPCYMVRGEIELVDHEYLDLYVRYIATAAGSINTPVEVTKFKHLKQTGYNVVGKLTAINEPECTAGVNCYPTPYFRVMSPLDGALVTGLKDAYSYADKPGAHLGFEVQFVRVVYNDGVESVGPLNFDCTSYTVSTTPNYWDCNARIEEHDAEDYVENGFEGPVEATTQHVTLVKVNPAYYPGCSVFQDTGGDLPIPKPTTTPTKSPEPPM